MTDFFETTIKNYSGLSSETKPTIAAGNQVPNGSRWRELYPDKTSKMYFFNLKDDAWYEYTESVSTTDDLHFDTFSLLNRILKELKIMNIQLALITDNEIKHTEVE